jgi:hypothetical protein
MTKRFSIRLTPRLAPLWALLITAAAHAQGVQTATIVGTVVDASGAVLPNARVALNGTRLIGGPREADADSAGRYRFSSLMPGAYDVTATRAGFSTASSHVDLPVGTTLTIDFVLAPAGFTEQIDVREPRAADVRSASIPAHFDRVLLENLPTSRSVAEVINLAPGVFNNVAFGGTQLSNAIYIDGVDITEPQLQDPWITVNYNWLEQVEVAALGAGAEYGESTGVFANTIIRSGGNRYDGLADYWTTRPSWVARNTNSVSEQLQRQFSPMRVLSWWDIGVQTGGPVVKDKLWFFTGAQARRAETRPAGYEGQGVIELTERRAIAKLTSAPAPAVRLDGFILSGHYDHDGQYLSPFTTIEATSETRQPQTTWNARLTWTLGSRTLIELRNGGFHSDQQINPERRDGPSPRYDLLTGIESVNAYEWFDLDRFQHTTVATLSHYRTGMLGEHDIRAGLELEQSDSFTATGFAGGMYIYDYGGVPDSALRWERSAQAVDSRRTAAFVQDAWAVGSRLTLHPGFRMDRNTAALPLIEDAVVTTSLSPKFGAAWDILGTHRLVGRAHVGRSHDPVFHMRVGTADISDSAPLLFGPAIGPDQFDFPTVTPGPPTFGIDPDLKQGYVDQVIAGVEWEAFRNVTVQSHYIRRGFERFMGLIDPSSRWIPVERQDPGPDGRLGTADDGPMLTVFDRDPATTIFNLSRTLRTPGAATMACNWSAGCAKAGTRNSRPRTRGHAREAPSATSVTSTPAATATSVSAARSQIPIGA